MTVYLNKFVMFSVVVALFGGLVPMSPAQTTGPQKGWLIIHGGGEVSDEIKKRFVALAGGSDANYVLIPTALQDEEIAARVLQNQGRSWAKSWGVSHVTVLHTRDK